MKAYLDEIEDIQPVLEPVYFPVFDSPIGSGPIFEPPAIYSPVVSVVPVTADPPASWAVGTFYGSAGGLRIVLTIGAGGNVTAVVNGSPSYGRLSGTTLTMGNAQSTVSQIAGGIRTSMPGQSIDYFTEPPTAIAPVVNPIVTPTTPIYTTPSASPGPTPPPPPAVPMTVTAPTRATAVTPTQAASEGEIDTETLLIVGGIAAAILLLS